MVVRLHQPVQFHLIRVWILEPKTFDLSDQVIVDEQPENMTSPTTTVKTGCFWKDN